MNDMRRRNIIMTKADKKVEELLNMLKEKGVVLSDKDKDIFRLGFKMGVTESIKIHTDTVNDYFNKEIEE